MRLNKLAGMLLLSGAVFVSCNGEALEPIRSRGNTAIIASDNRIQEAIDKINAGVNILENMKGV